VTMAQCREAGFTAGQVRSLCRDRRWLRLHEGLYLVDTQSGDGIPPRSAVIRAAMTSAGSQAVAVLGTAAELWNIAGAPGEDVIHASLPGPLARARRTTDNGVWLHQFVLRPEDVTTVDGIAVTTPARTVADLVLRSGRLTSVSVIDSALNRRIISADELDLVRALMSGRRGAATARPWIDEADGRAESPLETRGRMRAADGGVPPDELQFPVRDAVGTIVAIGDMAWLRGRRGVIGEADGIDAHDNPVAVFRDRKRQNAVIAAGYGVIRFTWKDTLDPDTIPRAVRAALRMLA
jgi:hypothetical protein